MRVALPGTPSGTRTRPLIGPAVSSMLPFAIMAVVLVIDILAGPQFGLLPVLSLGPALAAVSLRPVQTLLVGALALGLCALLASYDDLLVSRRNVIAMATIAGVSAAGIIASASRARREQHLADVTAVAEAAQRVLLRPVAGEVGPLQLAVRYFSASAAARIGGDLYDVIDTRKAIRLIVADVQGKGLPAVQTAALVLGAFREAAFDEPDLAGIAARIDRSLRQQVGDEEFVTAVLAEARPGTNVLELLSCGHPPPLLVADGAVRAVDTGPAGLPLGLADMSAGIPETTVIELRRGQRILFYTDGISEARDNSGRFYPLEHCGPLLRGPDPEAALDRLRDDVIRHAGRPLQDDATMLLVEPHSASGSG